MKRFLIVANDEKDIDLSLSRGIADYLTKKGLKTEMLKNDYTGEVPKADVCLVCGGDGTLNDIALYYKYKNEWKLMKTILINYRDL